MELKYMNAELDDLEEIYSCLKEVLLFCEPCLADPETALMQLYRRIRDNIGAYTIVKRDEEKVAFLYFHEADGIMWVDDLYVFEPFRNNGIATMILRYCMSETELPMKAVIYSNNYPAVTLFRHHAFTISEWLDRRRYIASNENNFPYFPEIFYGDLFDDNTTLY